MTGFARQNDELIIGRNHFTWYWEVKSVNSKALDVKIKLPYWLDALSPALKNVISSILARGSVSAYLDISNSAEAPQIKINQALLNQITVKAIELYECYGDKLQKPSTSELFSIKGVLDIEESKLNEDELALLHEALLKSFGKVCNALQADRQQEGGNIKIALLEIIDKISMIVGRIENIAEVMPEKIKEKLLLQIKTMLEPNANISQERLAQEVVLYVARADIREEIDRLKAHLKTAKDLLASNEAVGRRLDFLCQELNREANTTCSKSSDIDLTNLGMELKAFIEQLREQVQNIE